MKTLSLVLGLLITTSAFAQTATKLECGFQYGEEMKGKSVKIEKGEAEFTTLDVKIGNMLFEASADFEQIQIYAVNEKTGIDLAVSGNDRATLQLQGNKADKNTIGAVCVRR